MPKKFDQGIREEILKRIETGESLHRICQDKDMPNEKTVYDWLKDEVKPENVAFSKNYARAREKRADFHFEEIMEIADNATPDTYQQDRLRIDARKWMLGKMQPKKYGDKVIHSGDDESPISVTISGAEAGM